MEDERDVLKDEKPFGYTLTKDGKAIVSWRGKRIMILNKKVDALRELVMRNDEHGIQLLLAKATGNFKHGNERR